MTENWKQKWWSAGLFFFKVSHLCNLILFIYFSFRWNWVFFWFFFLTFTAPFPQVYGKYGKECRSEKPQCISNSQSEGREITQRKGELKPCAIKKKKKSPLNLTLKATTEGSVLSDRETGGLFPFERTCQITQTCFQPLLSKVATDGGRAALWTGCRSAAAAAAAVFPVCLSAHTGSQRSPYTEHRSHSLEERCLPRCVLSFTHFFYFPHIECGLWTQSVAAAA